VDTCTEELLRDTREASDALGVPVSLHASQSIVEFIEMNHNSSSKLRLGHRPIPQHQFRREVGQQ
jgi:cytosine/adenosine deaminase-related metal-dependent hydrolase